VEDLVASNLRSISRQELICRPHPSDFDATSVSTSKLVKATFKSMSLTGDFYNGAGWGASGAAENMAVYLTSQTTITGIIITAAKSPPRRRFTTVL
jgi:hypothetical protein